MRQERNKLTIIPRGESLGLARAFLYFRGCLAPPWAVVIEGVIITTPVPLRKNCGFRIWFWTAGHMSLSLAQMIGQVEKMQEFFATFTQPSSPQETVCIFSSLVYGASHYDYLCLTSGIRLSFFFFAWQTSSVAKGCRGTNTHHVICS